ncbi:hypothetical protein Rleg5DRAFT_7184 [Rhizobium leguminosarum bv. viciae WSM1455]|nr:hypothetical protein Rleg5DRAFT_7184 [Rhizobium leguminosarum bv. viciae WSM1455]
MIAAHLVLEAASIARCRIVYRFPDQAWRRLEQGGPTRLARWSLWHGHRDGRVGEARRDQACHKCAPSGTACRGQSVPGSARCERRSANPPAATLLTGQAVRELAPARTRLRLVCSLFGGALPWPARPRVKLGHAAAARQGAVTDFWRHVADREPFARLPDNSFRTNDDRPSPARL